MKRLIVVLASLATACIDFESKVDAGGVAAGGGSAVGGGGGTGGGAAQDGGEVTDAGDVSDADDAGPGLDAGTGGDAGPTDACPGFTLATGFCWVHPTPTGEDLNVVFPRGDELWFGGAGGLLMRWSPNQAPAWTRFNTVQNGVSAGAVRGFIETDAGFFAFGEYVGVQRWTGSSWTAVVTPSANETYRAAAAVPGGLEVVGAQVTARWSGGSWQTQSSPTDSTDVVALPAGVLVASQVDTGAGYFSMELHGGGFDASFPGGYEPRLWLEADGGPWFADGFHVGRLTSSGFDGSALPARRGRWSPTVDKHVLVGSSAYIGEFTSAALVSSALPGITLFGPWGFTPDFFDVAVFPDGGGLAVGSVGMLATRGPSSWTPGTFQPRPIIDTISSLLPLPGGAVLALSYAGELVTLQPTADLSRDTVPGVGLYAGWAGPSGVIVVGRDQTTGGATLFDQAGTVPGAPPSGTPLTGIAGSSVNDLTVVGESGYFAHWDGNAWAEATAPAAGQLEAVVSTPAGVFVASDKLGVLRVQGASLQPFFGADAGAVHALLALDGVLWAAGDNNSLWALPLDGGAPRRSVAPFNAPNANLYSLVASPDGGLYVLPFDQPSVVHLEADGGWHVLPTGAQQTYFRAITVSTDGVHHWLWLAGEGGAVLRKRLD